MKRHLIFGLLVIAFLWFAISRLTEIKLLTQTLIQGQWEWVLVAAALQFVYFVGRTAVYQSAFKTVEVESKIPELLPVFFVSIFINVATPTGGTGGIALFAQDAARRGKSSVRTTVGTVLFLIADFVAVMLVLVPGMTLLFIYHDLQRYEVFSALILLAITGGLTSLLLLGLWLPDHLQKFMLRLQQLINHWSMRINKRRILPEYWAAYNAAELALAAQAVAKYPKQLAHTILIALAARLIDLFSLYTLFLAFHQPSPPGVIVAGYAMGILFWIVSIMPQGIGVVEGVMTLVFTSLGIPPENAAVISLAYRGLALWLPLIVGFFLLRTLPWFKKRPLPAEKLNP